MFKTVIIYCNYGRLGNRLHTHVNVLGWCINNGYNLLNLSFKSYSKYFHNIHNCSSHILNVNNSLLIRFIDYSSIQLFLEILCRSNKWLKRFSWFVETIDKEDCTSLSEKELTASFSNSKKIKIIRSWDINCPVSLRKHTDRIKKILTPNLNTILRSECFISNLRQEYTTIIGVHARRGDYKNYLYGQHYHSWEKYQKWISETKMLFEKQVDQRVGFLICSDENPISDIFTSLPVHFIPEPEMICDMHALSLCDYNIGPPSSFGTWISWYGNVPRLVVQKDTKVYSVDQFKTSETC